MPSGRPLSAFFRGPHLSAYFSFFLCAKRALENGARKKWKVLVGFERIKMFNDRLANGRFSGTQSQKKLLRRPPKSSRISIQLFSPHSCATISFLSPTPSHHPHPPPRPTPTPIAFRRVYEYKIQSIRIPRFCALKILGPFGTYAGAAMPPGKLHEWTFEIRRFHLTN